MIKIIIGNLDILNDNRISIDGRYVHNTDIPQILDTIWAFNFDEGTNTGEIEFQNPQQNNNQYVNSLAELETTIGCTLQSIKDIHIENYVDPTDVPPIPE
jgi:hypothetical protein